MFRAPWDCTSPDQERESNSRYGFQREKVRSDTSGIILFMFLVLKTHKGFNNVFLSLSLLFNLLFQRECDTIHILEREYPYWLVYESFLVGISYNVSRRFPKLLFIIQTPLLSLLRRNSPSLILFQREKMLTRSFNVTKLSRTHLSQRFLNEDTACKHFVCIPF